MIAIATVASLLFVQSAMAAGSKQEFSLQGSIDNSSSSGGGGSSTSTFVYGSYGVYLNPKLVVRGVALLMADDSGGVTSSALGIGGGVKYYIGNPAKSKWVPFAQGDFSLISMEAGGTTGSGYGIEGGVGASNFITEDVSFDVSFVLYSNTVEFSGYSATIDGNRLTAGVTIRF